MARIKHTKNELRAQRDALQRFERFLPMLQLKKQQLQAELQAIQATHAAAVANEQRILSGMASWVRLLAEPVNLDSYIQLDRVETTAGNIAGVAIPILSDVVVRTNTPDLFATPPWLDDAMDTLQRLIRLRAEREILERQQALLAEELRVTAQRVNLFEKVKIPECRENIRTIRIFLGDQQTAGVARAKIAKRRTVAYQAAEARGAA
jgi:V/A-type H+/Na+-transporting ATPase subunit D